MPGLIVGIDGGGTSCRAAVADSGGRILGRGKSGAANILTDPDAALENILDATRLAFREAGIAEERIAHTAAIVGVAGHNVGDAVHYVAARLPFQRSDIESDGLIALQGALGHADGAVAILGTGTIYIVRSAGTVRYVGGWGFSVGDLGSGARLGHAALQESLLAHDGIHPPGALTASILQEFGDPGTLVEFARAAHPGDFARFAPRVFAFATEGDATSRRIIDRAAGDVDAALDAVVAILGDRGALALLGGLALPYRPYLAPRHLGRLVEPASDALSGAVALAAVRFGASSGVSA